MTVIEIEPFVGEHVILVVPIRRGISQSIEGELEKCSNSFTVTNGSTAFLFDADNVETIDEGMDDEPAVVRLKNP